MPIFLRVKMVSGLRAVETTDVLLKFIIFIPPDVTYYRNPPPPKKIIKK
jgi:hypothetical protein